MKNSNNEIRTVPLEENDKEFAKLYREEYSKLSEEDKLKAFRSIIRRQGNCGFANSGHIEYLLNTDNSNRYRVTIRTYWTQGIDNGQFDQTIIVEAGERKLIGCTDSGQIPVAHYNRQVVGETLL